MFSTTTTTTIKQKINISCNWVVEIDVNGALICYCLQCAITEFGIVTVDLGVVKQMNGKLRILRVQQDFHIYMSLLKFSGK